MNSQTIGTSDPRGLRRLSRTMAIACLALMILLPPALALYWALADGAELAMRAGLAADALQAPLLTWQRLAAGLVAQAPLALLLVGVWEARKCFRLFSQGQVFAWSAVRHLKRFAGWVLASVVAGVVAGAAISVLITLHNPPGMRHLAVNIGTDQVFTVFFAGMVWLMAAVIGHGQFIADENAAFI